MKKKIALIVLLLLMVVCLLGCDGVTMESVTTQAEGEKRAAFVVVEEGDGWKIVYDTDTMVMYVMSTAAYNYGDFTMLCNRDGTPKLYRE